MSGGILRRICEHAIGAIALFGFSAGLIVVCLSPHPFSWGALYVSLPFAIFALAVRRRQAALSKPTTDAPGPRADLENS